MKTRFGSNKLSHTLEKLGFVAERRTSGTSHLKYCCDSKLKGVRPFIIVILGKKVYDPNTCSSYITEITRLGFDRKKVIDLLK